MFKRAYVEITNRCNLQCSFCHGTCREIRDMTVSEFQRVTDQLRKHTKYLYFHVMGEPLLHNDLDILLKIAEEKGLKVCLTTNGTLLKKKGYILLNSKALDKVSISLHSFEGNQKKEGLEEYINCVWSFAEDTHKKNIKCALRLWNVGGADTLNGQIEEILSAKSGKDVKNLSRDPNGNRKIDEKLFLESAEKFDWPDIEAQERNTQFCHGLRQQIGVLSNGTVIPCCLDAEGQICLGNIYTEEIDEILQKPRTKVFIDGFSRRAPTEELCRKCGYAERFSL